MSDSSHEFNFGAHYRVLQRIGAGASGIVYLAVHKDTDERVAIKFLREEYRDDIEILQRFIAERTKLTSLESNHIIHIRDLIAEDGRLGIVMDYVPGPTLTQYLRDAGTLAPAEALGIARQIFQGLQYAHSHGVIHRDIKPDNIILLPQAEENTFNVVISDFGVASIVGQSHLTTTRMVGTPAYMAPELIESAIVAPSVDIYAVGILLYQMLAGSTPFSDGAESNPFTIAHRHITQAVPPIPGLEPQISAFLNILLSKNPINRADVSDVLKRLDGITIESTYKHALPPLNIHDTDFHPATVIKSFETVSTTQNGEKAEEEAEDELSPSKPTLASFTPSSSATLLKPYKSIQSEQVQNVNGRKPKGRQVRIIAISALASFVGVILILLSVWIAQPYFARRASHKSPTSQVISARREDDTLPSGLRIIRDAQWNSSKKVIDYTIRYSSVKNPIMGQVMETLSTSKGKCLTVHWGKRDAGISIHKHSPARTAINASCSWTITLPKLVKNSVSIQAEITVQTMPSSSEDLDRWLKNISENTIKNLSRKSVTSTSYPLQRLKSMRIDIPNTVTQGEAIPLSIIGMWPNGENAFTPIYMTPWNGEPTSILRSITGGQDNQLRLTDRCSGAVVISSDGHDVSALFPSTCSIGADIGNYEIQDTSVTITSNGS
ncbi:serine/threonine protein kinase [Alloscardovia venturai]|uniref:Serine/threonine protein kinase n=1 Tax=Alloscardovia venturai TaxID=1769421 RepID=A0ABW2Y6W2_9BIFI